MVVSRIEGKVTWLSIFCYGYQNFPRHCRSFNPSSCTLSLSYPSYCQTHDWASSFIQQLHCGAKVVLHETIRNDDIQHNTTLQHRCDIVTNSQGLVRNQRRGREGGNRGRVTKNGQLKEGGSCKYKPMIMQRFTHRRKRKFFIW